MRTPAGKHPRLKQVKGQIFSCGMFGACSHSVLSPRTPPPQQAILPLKQHDTEKPQKIASQREENSSVAQVRSASEKLFERVPSSTQWDFALEQEGRIKNRYLALIQRELNAPEGSMAEDQLCPDSQVVTDSSSSSVCVEDLVAEIMKGSASAGDLKKLRLFSAESDENRECVMKAGVASAMVSILLESPDGCVTASEEALSLLAAIADCESTKAMIAHPQMLPVMQQFLENGSVACKMNAISLLLKLTSEDAMNRSVGAAAGVMEAVVKLLDRPHLAKVTKRALKLLLALCLCEENRRRAVEVGAVAALVELLPGMKSVNAERALATLELLCTVSDGRSVLLQHALAVPLLVSVILRVSDRGSEYAAGVLCWICNSENVEALEMALEVCAPTQMLLLLQSDCTDRARRKALKLLKIFHTFCEDSSCIFEVQNPKASLK